MSDKLSEHEGSNENQLLDSNSGTERESVARATEEIHIGDDPDDISKEEGTDAEKDTSGSEDSGGDKLYSDFLKDNMEYDSKEDTDFALSQGDSNDESDGSDSGDTEIEGPQSEEEVNPDEMDSDDERLITLPQLQTRSHFLQAKVRLLSQMKDDELQAVQNQIAFLTNNAGKKLDAKYKLLNKMFRDLLEMEIFLKIGVEIEKSKKEFNTALNGTTHKKSRRELQYATKHVELAENVDSLLQSIICLLKMYFDVNEGKV